MNHTYFYRINRNRRKPPTHDSKKLNKLLFKKVEITFKDGETKIGFLEREHFSGRYIVNGTQKISFYKTNVKKIALEGVVTSNPTLKLVLGTCPTLALTTSAMNGIGMGAAVIFVLICSNVLISLLRNVIPKQVRIPAFILIIATIIYSLVSTLKKNDEKFIGITLSSFVIVSSLMSFSAILFYCNKNSMYAIDYMVKYQLGGTAITYFLCGILFGVISIVAYCLKPKTNKNKNVSKINWLILKKSLLYS